MNKLQKYFGTKEIPQILKDLYDFDRTYNDAYANFFCMIPEDSMCEFIDPDNTAFSSRLIEFAQGGESLATYALWLHAEDCDLENTPVVFMGNGSGPNLIAKDLKDFLRVLSYDTECGGDYYYKDCEDYEMSPNHMLYARWLKEQGLEPIKSCNEDDKDLGYDEVTELTNKATKLYGDSFNRWLHVVQNPDEELVLDNLDTNGIEAQKVEINSIEDCIELLFRPMDDTYLLGAFDALNIPRPILDGNYIKEGSIDLKSEDGTIFLGMEKEEKNSLPVLVNIGFDRKSSLNFPFDIKIDDSYVQASDKIGRKAEFQHCISDEMKIWIFENKNGQKYEFTVFFYEDNPYRDVWSIILSDEEPDNREENLD